MQDEQEIIEQEETSTASFEIQDGKLVDNSSYEDNPSQKEESASSESDTPISEAQPEEEQQEQETQEEAESESENDSTEPIEDEQDDATFYADYSKEVGLDIKSEDEITSALKELAELRKQPNLLDDPELKAFVEFKQKGGDTKTYHSLKSKDFDGMDTKSLLKEKFFLDNADLAAKNKELAESRFNREYRGRFGLLDKMAGMDEEELEEFKAENGQEIKDLQLDLDYEMEEARNSLKEWQTKSTAPPQPEEQTSPEEIERINNEYLGKVKQTLDGFQGLKVDVGPNSEPFTVGLTPQEKEEYGEIVKNPRLFFEEVVGLSEDGRVDPDKMFEAVARYKKFNQIGQHLSDYILETRNAETIEAKVTNPNIKNDVSQEREMTERDMWLSAKHIN